MRVCMVFYDVQDFGGLEEYAVNLAISLQRLGHDVSCVSAAWVPPDNQYKRRLREGGVACAEVPKWLSLPASDWDTKIRMLDAFTVAASPLVYLLAAVRCLVKRAAWGDSLTSARGWLRDQVLRRFLGRDRREVLGRLLLRWWRLRWRPDVVHLHGYTTNLLFAIEWARAAGLPVVYEEHQTPDAQFDWWRDFAHTINKADIVVAVSDTSAQALRTVCGVTQPIVVRGPLLRDPLEGAPINRGGARSAGAFTVTTVARLYVTKGLTYLLDAIARVRRVHPDAQFRVYGDGPLRDELVEQARGLGLEPDAIFKGAFTDRDALARIMAETDLVVMPSILEGQPLALVEAMAYGCPIVATSVGGIPELITSGVNGLLCPPGDVEALATHIEAMIQDSVMRERLGREARRSYETGQYQPSVVARQFVSIYSDAIARRAAHPQSPSP